MDILNPADLRSLITITGRLCISLYMPTNPIAWEQEPIRLKNLLVMSEARLAVSGLRGPEVHKLMRPAEELRWNKDFWQHQSEGLAIFLSNDFFEKYRLPARFEELLIITNSFHIKPLLPLLGMV